MMPAPEFTAAASAEAGAGTVLGILIVGSLAAVLGMTLPLYMALAVRESVARSADASALAGADVAAGIAPGVPCEVAGVVASANRVSLAGCTVDGLVVTVTTGVSFLGLPLHASATAGPPGAVTN
jgi:secretion/DNA translocation related TadE-like protein